MRVGGFATGIRVSLLPVLAHLGRSHPGIEVIISEFEPVEAFRLLADDNLDLALTYDYNLAPAGLDSVLESVALWSASWGLGVPEPAPAVFEAADYADVPWIVNSRNSADEVAVRTLASLAGFTPYIAHQIDSLELVEDLILHGYGVGLLPLHRHARRGVTVLPLPDPGAVMTAYAVTRRGRTGWPPLRLILDALQPEGSTPPRLEHWPSAVSRP